MFAPLCAKIQDMNKIIATWFFFGMTHIIVILGIGIIVKTIKKSLFKYKGKGIVVNGMKLITIKGRGC